MFVADTNLLVYAVNRTAAGHAQARELVEAWRAGDEPWFLTWSIIYEFLQVTTWRRLHRQILSVADARMFVTALLASPTIGLLMETPRHAAILGELLDQQPGLSGGLMHDLHIVALMKEHGVSEIRTADVDFHRFSFLRVVNPLVG